MGSKAPHLVFHREDPMVSTSPTCERDDHEACSGHGDLISEWNLLVVHVQWWRPIACGCTCHLFTNEAPTD